MTVEKNGTGRGEMTGIGIGRNLGLLRAIQRNFIIPTVIC
jgi:hypothetical protein